METSSLTAAAQAAAQDTGVSRVDAKYGASLTSDVGSFSSHLQQAEASAGVAPLAEPSEAARALFKPLDRINIEAQELVKYAQDATASGNELSASEIVMLTVRSQEFMFHAQLTANVANRTADGMQQLFKQQG